MSSPQSPSSDRETTSIRIQYSVDDIDADRPCGSLADNVSEMPDAAEDFRRCRAWMSTTIIQFKSEFEFGGRVPVPLALFELPDRLRMRGDEVIND